MLILTRRNNEKIRILLEDGREIIMTVFETSKYSARLGFEADRSITIIRDELEYQPNKVFGVESKISAENSKVFN